MPSTVKETDQAITRRDFMKHLSSAAGVLALTSLAQSAETLTPAAGSKLPKRILGKTGKRVTILGLGGAGHLADGPEEQAVALVERALELGVNYFDTHRGYGQGRSEQCLGQVMQDPAKRRKVFLTTKITIDEPRTRDVAWRSLEASLRALRTDYLDCLMVANIERQADVDRILASDGSVSAMQEAQQQGLVRFLGIAGHHDPEPLVYAMERFPFDVLLVGINAADPHYKSLIHGALPMAQKHEIGIVAMKVASQGRLLQDAITMEQALTYSLSQPGVATAIVGCLSLTQLEDNVRIACSFQPMGTQAQQVLVARARPAADANCNYWQLRA